MRSAGAKALDCSEDDVTVNYDSSDKSADVSLGDTSPTPEQMTQIAAELTKAMQSYSIRQ